jgi:hypothetical protein
MPFSFSSAYEIASLTSEKHHFSLLLDFWGLFLFKDWIWLYSPGCSVSNSRFFCFFLLSARITGMWHYAQIEAVVSLQLHLAECRKVLKSLYFTS